MSDPEVRARIEELTAEILPQARAEAYKVWQRAPHVLELDELHSLALSGLAAAAARWETYCVYSSVRVLTAGLDWVPAGSLEVGQELVGFDEHPVMRGARRYHRSAILGVNRHLLPCVRITFEDGREVTCSMDHRWLACRRSGLMWRSASEMGVGDEIFSPFQPWERESSFESGWLSGIFDAEGNIGHSYVSVAQNPGPVLDRIKQGLKAMDLHFRTNTRTGDRVEIVQVAVRRDYLELLGRLQPPEQFQVIPAHGNLDNLHPVPGPGVSPEVEIHSFQALLDAIKHRSGILGYGDVAMADVPFRIEDSGQPARFKRRLALPGLERREDFVTDPHFRGRSPHQA